MGGATLDGATLLRVATGGSVDDGKSTLIGRLLLDTKQVFEDQLESVRSSNGDGDGDGVNLAHLTDGLRAERERGITIDVAYRYFATPRRRFVLADTPGHEEFTRNMVTGASRTDVTIVLVDATQGIVSQSRRHLAIAAVLRVPHVLACVNKLDAVDYDEQRFAAIAEEFAALAAHLGVADQQAVPISALKGDNVVERSQRMPWYEGPSLLEVLETLPPAPEGEGTARLAVQCELETFEDRDGDALHANDIGRLRLRLDRPLAVDPYAASRYTGSLILIDPRTNATVAGLMVEEVA
jgi:sulfate adenylyltransferase subunit 1 (EFTu-like GTPase family)